MFSLDTCKFCSVYLYPAHYPFSDAQDVMFVFSVLAQSEQQTRHRENVSTKTLFTYFLLCEVCDNVIK